MDQLYPTLKNLSRTSGLGFIHYNAKVGISLDLDSICPKKEAGQSCEYCYVEAMKSRSFMRMKERVYYDSKTWSQHEAQKFEKFLERFATIRSNYPNLFLRIFARSDYKRKDKRFWRDIGSLATKHNVPAVVITKQLKCVHDLAAFMTRIQFSIDLVSKDSISRKAQATYARRRYDNVIIRSVACSEQDILTLGATSDLITLFHNDAQGQHRRDLKKKFPDTIKPSWKPENYKGRVQSMVCCAEKGPEKHAKCVYCGNCLKKTG